MSNRHIVMYLESWQKYFFDSGFLEEDWAEKEVSVFLDFLDFPSPFESSLAF